MYQIQFRLELRLHPALPDPSWIKGPTSNGRGGDGKGRGGGVEGTRPHPFTLP